MNAKAKGTRNERRAKRMLEEAGYYCVRAGGSLGLFDLAAFSRGGCRFVQVKTNRKPKQKERVATTRDMVITTIHIGKAGGWRYLVQSSMDGARFLVLRWDLAFDQVEEELGMAYSLEEAKIMAQVEIERTRRSLARRGRPCPPFDWKRWGRKFGVRQNSECRELFSDYVTSDLI